MAMYVKSVFAVATLMCLGALGDASGAANSGGHPIEKVIKLLKGLKEKAILEGNEEGVLYQKFSLWCAESTDTLQDAIADEKEKIAELSDLLDGKTEENSSLAKEIKSLKEQLFEMGKSEVRMNQHMEWSRGNYSKKMKTLKGTLEAMGECLHVMQDAEVDTEEELEDRGRYMLVQQHLKKIVSLASVASSVTMIPAGQEISELQALADQPKEEDPKEAEARKKAKEARKAERRKRADAREKRKDEREERAKRSPDREGDRKKHEDVYDFKSEKVIELLKELKTKFEDEIQATIKAQTNARNEKDLEELALNNAVAAATESKKKKTEIQADVQDTIGETKASLENLREDLKVDSTSHKDTKGQCATKKDEWDERSKTRENEIGAMDAAIKILAEATSVRTEAPANPAVLTAPAGLTSNSYKIHDFLQIEQIGSKDNPKMSAVLLLREAAGRTHSKALERLSVEIKAHLSGPFDQLGNMIEKMIFRLMDEQRQEDEHKDWCDHELATSKQLKHNQTRKIDRIKADYDKEKGKLTDLTMELNAADDKFDFLVKFMGQATEIRKAGKQENKLAIKDAEKAQTALENAIAVLRDFYKESGAIEKKAWEFMQKPDEKNIIQNDAVDFDKMQAERPSTWAKPYNAVKNSEPGDPKKGVVAVLENEMANFASMEAATKAQEVNDQEKYEQVIFDCKEEKARLTTEREMKSNEKKRRADKMVSLERHAKSTGNELESTEDYLKKLKPACVEGDSSYKQRKGARNDEIKALKKAQVILQDAFDNEKIYKKDGTKKSYKDKYGKKAAGFLDIDRA